MARPSKYSKAMVKNLCRSIREGSTYKDACAKEGIHYDSFNEWHQKFSEFSEAIDRAEADFKAARITRISAAGYNPKTGKGDWRADLALLERRFPEEYSLRTRRLEHQHLIEGAENARKVIEAIFEAATKAR